MAVQYRTPRIEGSTVVAWEDHRGRIELVDPRWEMALLVPENKEEGWIWIPFVYCKPVHDA